MVLTVEKVSVFVAAPGPLPTAGTLPTCLAAVVVEATLSIATEVDNSDLVNDCDPGTGVPDVSDAAPGPSPTAGTLPVCFGAVVKVSEATTWPGEDDSTVVSSFAALMFELCKVSVRVVMLDRIEAAPGPSPTAGTLPVCFETGSLEAATTSLDDEDEIRGDFEDTMIGVLVIELWEWESSAGEMD